MGKANSGWVRRNAALLLSATLAVSPVMAVPALAGETDGDAAPQEQTVENGEQSTDEGVEKDPEVEKTPDAETVDPEAEKDPDAEQGTGEKDGAAAEVTEQPATDQPAAEPRSGGVAKVEKDGTITSYPSLREAVDAVNAKGGTLTLLESTSENITILRAGVTVTADPSVEYRGSLTLAEGCIVENMSFRNPGSTKVDKCFSNCINMADGATVTNCTFTVPSGVWAKKPGNDIWWQPNCISVKGNQGCIIKNNTFKLGLINEMDDDGTIADSDSNVAINLIGPNVSDITIADNTMYVTEPAPGATRGAAFAS